MKLAITSPRPGVAIVAIPTENLDASNVKEFREAIMPVVQEYDTVLVDMTATKFVDSSGLGALLGLWAFGSRGCPAGRRESPRPAVRPGQRSAAQRRPPERHRHVLRHSSTSPAPVLSIMFQNRLHRRSETGTSSPR